MRDSSQDEDSLDLRGGMLRQMLDAMPVAVVLVGRDGRLLYRSKEFEELLGYTAEDIRIESDWWLRAYPDKQYREHVERAWREETERAVREHDKPRPQEWVVTCKDGSRRDIEFSAAVVGDYHLIVFKDITERKQQEARLLDSEARFKTLARASFEGIVVSHDGVMLDVNDQFLAITGYSREEVVGKPVLDLIAPESRATVAKAIASQRLEPYEHTMVRKDGRALQVETRARSVQVGGRLLRITAVRDITERKRIETELISANERLRALIDSSPLAIIALDPEGRVTQWSPAAEAIFGWTDDEAVGRVLPLVPEEKREEYAKLRQRVLSGEGFLNVEARRIRRDGTPVDISISTVPLRDSSGRVTGILGIVADITEQKQAREALRFTQYTVDNAEDSIMHVGHDGRIVYANNTASRLLEYSHDELKGMHLWDFVPEYPRERWYELWESLKKAGPSVFDVTNRAKSGRLIELEVRAGIVEYGSQEIQVSFARDITERKRTEKALRERTEELDRIFSLSLDMLCIADIDGYFRRLNPAWEKALGYRPDEMEGRRFLDFVHPDDIQSTIDTVAELSAGNDVIDYTNRYRHKDGSYRWIEWRSKPYEERFIYAAARDITERVYAEDALKRSEELLRQSQRVARLGHYELDIRSDRWISSEALDEIFGIGTVYPRTLQGWLSLIHPDDRDAMRTYQIDHVLTEKNRFDKEYRIVRASDGKVRWMHGLGDLEFNTAGEPVRMFGTIQDITERKLAEDALEKSEARFSSLFNSMSEGVALHDIVYDESGRAVDYIIVGVNPAYESITGIPRSQSIGKKATVVYHSDEAPYLAVYAEVAATGRGATFETYYAPLAVHLLVSAFAPGRGSFATTFTDITERKKAEDALRKEKAFSDAVIDSVPGLLYLYDDHGCLVRWNKKHEELTGYSADELSHISVLSWFRGEDAERVRKSVEMVAAVGYASTEANLTTKSGATVLFYFTGVRLVIDSRPYLVGIGIDVTERKRAEEDLARTNEELRMLNRLISETSGAVDLKSILDMALDEALRIAAVEGGTVCLVRPDDVFELAAHRGTSDTTIAEIEAGEIKVGECLCGMCAKDGKPLILSTRDEVLDYATRESLRGEDIRFHAAFPLMVESRCVGVLCVFTRTDKKPTERSLRLLETATKQVAVAVERARLFDEVKRNAEELEHRVAERTAQLESANKELEAFSYSVSHDLRAPLRAIDGFSLVVLEDYEDKLDEEGKGYLNRIRSAAVKMGNLIDDILRLSRITRAEIVRGPVNLSEMAGSVVSDLVESQPGRKVDVIIEPDLFADADANLMRIALENLIGNAWKFTSKKDIARIEFGAMTEAGKKTYYVKDNGAGFDQAYAGKLFGAFQRLHSDSEFPGTGIGLATAKRIIHKHGGRVWATGEVDKGAAFYFTLD